MNITNKKLFLIALIFGIIATAGVYFYLTKMEESIETIEPTEGVVVAKVTISSGTLISQEMVGIKKLKEGSIPPSALKSLDLVVGKLAKEKIYKDEPVIHERLVDEVYSKKHLAYSIPKGFRAITLQYNPVMGVSGFIQPGDFIDIVGSYNKENSPLDRNMTKLILDKVLVLAVGNNVGVKLDKEDDEIKTITLAVTPQQVEMISFTEEFASIKLILRPLGDNAEPATIGITKDSIFTP